MADWLTSFWDKNNNDLLLEVVKAGVIFSLGVFCRGIGKGILFFFKFIYKGFRTLLLKSKRWFRSISRKVKYKRLIKQIENMEISIPDNFLLGKSPEKNPELKKIFQLIKDGVIPAPKSYQIDELLRKLQGIKPEDFKLNIKPEKVDPTKVLKK